MCIFQVSSLDGIHSRSGNFCILYWCILCLYSDCKHKFTTTTTIMGIFLAPFLHPTLCSELFWCYNNGERCAGVLTVLNCVSVKWSAKGQTALTSFSLLSLVFIVAIGLSSVLLGQLQHYPSRSLSKEDWRLIWGNTNPVLPIGWNGYVPERSFPKKAVEKAAKKKQPLIPPNFMIGQFTAVFGTAFLGTAFLGWCPLRKPPPLRCTGGGVTAQ